MHGGTALMAAAWAGQAACVQALLKAGANTELLDRDGRTALQWAEVQGHTLITTLILKYAPPCLSLGTAELVREHAAPPQLAIASPAAPPAAPSAPPSAGKRGRAPPSAGKRGRGPSSPASLPVKIFLSAQLGEVQKVVRWLTNGGPIDALCTAFDPTPGVGGKPVQPASSLLHAAVTNGRLEMVRELLERGAKVDLPNSFGYTALMEAAGYGHASVVLLLLQHSANPNMQSRSGIYQGGDTALMVAANQGHEECVQTLLHAGADTELLDNNGHTALQYAKRRGHTGTVSLIRWRQATTWVVYVVLGAIALAAFSFTLAAVLKAVTPPAPDVSTARTRARHRPARYAKAKGQMMNSTEPTRQHALPSQPDAAVALHAMQEALDEEEAKEAKWLADRATVIGYERRRGTTWWAWSEQKAEREARQEGARLAAAQGAGVGVAAEEAEREVRQEAARLAAAQGAREEVAAEQAVRVARQEAVRLAAAEGVRAGLAAEEAEREVRQEAARLASAEGERERVAAEQAVQVARQEAARLAWEEGLRARVVAEQAVRMAVASKAREVAVAAMAASKAAARVAAASKAREVAVAAVAALEAATEAAAAAEAEADALERATADGGVGEGGSSDAAGRSVARKVAVPDQYMCSITAEIMTDPVSTVRLSALDNPCSLSCTRVTLSSTRLHHLTLHTSQNLTLPPHRERKTGRRLYVRTPRHRAVAQDPQHLAVDGRRAREQAAHPVPLSP
tara:strand:+ start:915 stop:3134 length:2220 start_codon:yes stop_codon:yes gene_type:complete